MNLNQFVTLKELFALVRRSEDRNCEYSVYWKDDADDPCLNEAVLAAAPVAVENDREIFPKIVIENSYWIFCSDQIIQDVVDAALDQDPQVSDEKLRESLIYYIQYDNFLNITDTK